MSREMPIGQRPSSAGTLRIWSNIDRLRIDDAIPLRSNRLRPYQRLLMPRLVQMSRPSGGPRE